MIYAGVLKSGGAQNALELGLEREEERKSLTELGSWAGMAG